MLIGVHPEPPSPTEADSSLPRDAELVLIGREIVKERKERPREVGDLLDVMLKARDPESGEGMRDELIRYEM